MFFQTFGNKSKFGLLKFETVAKIQISFIIFLR